MILYLLSEKDMIFLPTVSTVLPSIASLFKKEANTVENRSYREMKSNYVIILSKLIPLLG